MLCMALHGSKLYKKFKEEAENMKNLLNCRTLIKLAIMIVVVALIGSQMIDTYSGGGNNKKGDNGSDDGGTTSASGFDQFEDGDNKVTICHHPPGNPANAHTIIVGAAAVDAHVRNHGDTLGPCNSSEDECVAAFDACVSGATTPEEEEACAQDLALCLAVSDCEPCCQVARDLCEDGLGDENVCDDSFLACLRGAGCLFCGDGIVQAGLGEECDDGNTNNGDGCSSSCQTEVPAPVCGNGTLEAGEECDDGNTVDLDGCSSNCQTEHACIANPGICDDGNDCTDDSCDPVLGCINTPTPSTTICYDEGLGICDGTGNCVPSVCGNGVVEFGEMCDNGEANCDTCDCRNDCTYQL